MQTGLHPARQSATTCSISLSGSFQTTPMFCLNHQNGVNYNLVAQPPQYDIQSLQDIQNIPLGGAPAAGRRRRSWAMSPRSSARRACRSSRTTTSGGWSMSIGSVQGRDLGAVAADVAEDRRGQPQDCCRAAASSPCAGRVDTMRSVLCRPARRPRLLDRSRLHADRGELPVLAGSVHHHHRASGGARGHRPVPVLHGHDAERAGADGRDHVHGRRDREQHPRGLLRERPAGRARRSDRRRRWKRDIRGSARC